MKRKRKFTVFLRSLTGGAALLLAVVCVFSRVWARFPHTAAQTVLREETPTYAEESYDSTESETEPTASTETEPETSMPAQSAEPQSEDVELYPVIESQIGAGAIVYSNFSVKNTTNYTIDFESLLSQELPFSINDTHETQVLIVHTHACESYLSEDTGYYPADYYPRTDDNEKNVTKVGESIANSLKDEGIGVVHCSTQHDNPSYNGSYDRSLQSIQSYMEKYPNIKVILDIHRDSLGSGGADGKIKPTFTYNGRKAAQMMIMTGYDGDGSYNYPEWEKNLVFALKLQQTAEEMFPGMTRPLYFGNFVYNLNVNSGSLLIEIGTDVNTLDEASYTGELLGKVLAKVLQNDE